MSIYLNDLDKFNIIKKKKFKISNHELLTYLNFTFTNTKKLIKQIQTVEKKKKKEKSKTIEIQKKIDPIDKLIQNLNRKETKIEDIEIKDKKDIEIEEIEEIDNQVEENKDIKKLTITASTKPDKKKTGGGFVIE